MAIPPGLLSEIGHQNITISPNGVMFVKSSIRKGLLARMLEEIIESRVMLKEAIGVWGKDNEVLYKKLDAWQLGLKLIANVTYGYTGASFSGRMPCVEVADSIVQTGRETLENAIRFIQSKHKTWGAEVVYGDTDSMFLHFPGKSRQAAFSLGQEIADAVTRLNPKPVKLKFEKVYQPCVLLTKKRYFGWMYTAADQAEPQLDVKGMELVRRDGCKIQQKILEGAIDVLFRENNLSLVKSFVVAQITKVLRREVPMEEFIIAKEVRLSKYLGRTMPAHAKEAPYMYSDDDSSASDSLSSVDTARFDTMVFIVAIQPLIRKPSQNSGEPDDSEPICNRLRAEFGDMGFRLSELQTTIADAYDMVREKTAVVCKLAELICTVSTSALQGTDAVGYDGPFSVVGRYLGTSERLIKVVKRDSELALDIFEQSNYLLKDNTENGVDPTDYTSVMYGVVSFLKELMCEKSYRNKIRTV
ncbi:DNA polymerase zeta [Coemansia sp. RSA 1939]|nr:DNA polymerase zeta [Coemansia sp. RSA 1939]